MSRLNTAPETIPRIRIFCGRCYSGLGRYADSDEYEHFAQAVAGYFDAGFQGEKRADVKRLDPKMYDQVERVFESKKGATP